MSRVDRDLNGTSTQRVSQTEIHRATERDDIGKAEPIKAASDMNWSDKEARSGPISVNLGELLMKAGAI